MAYKRKRVQLHCSKDERKLNDVYRTLMGEFCANRECQFQSHSGYHVYHIEPLMYGGRDRLYNLVMLCEGCHYYAKLHKAKEYPLTERLILYKCISEMRILGFVLDENDLDFPETLRRHMKKYNIQDRILENYIKEIEESEYEV